MSPTLSDEPCGFLTTQFLPHGTPYEMFVGCLYEWVSYKTLDIWAPSSKEGSEIRDMDLGVISWWKQFPLNWWSHSPRRWKRFFNNILKDSTKKNYHIFIMPPSTSHVFSFDAFYLPRKAGGRVHSFSFYFFLFLSTGFFSTQAKRLFTLTAETA